MIHTNNPIIKHKAGLLNLAEELGNVSRACKVMGVSRDTFYRYQELVEDGGIDNLINKSRRAPNTKNRVDEATERQSLLTLLISPLMASTAPATNCANPVCSYQVVAFAQSGFVTTWRTSKSV